VSRTYDTVSFLSDLGYESEHAGVVKAVIRESAPHVVVIDLTHGITPFDTRGASLSLARAVPYLTEGIVIAAVDPGASSERRLVAVEVAGGAGIFIGPDNGVLAPGVALAGGAERAVVLDRDELHLATPGTTFVARDVFAPIAALLANGEDLFDVGTEIDPSLLLPGIVPIPREENGGFECEVLWVDRFGNCQLNVSLDDLETSWAAPVQRVRVSFGDTTRNFVVAQSFAEMGQGAAGLVIDSSGLLCVAVDSGSATEQLGLGEGQQVTLQPGGDETTLSTPVSLRPTP
jgi:S-adenosyl-L-methionine hydrolase (adenosine-forming)